MNFEKANKRIEECLRIGSKSLDLSGCGIQDLNNIPRLQACTHLKELNLSRNKISDISPLAYLTKLRNLWLNDNHIRDFSTLKSLTNLTELILHQNEIIDISPLERLINLEILGLNRNKVRDFSPLKSLTNLTELYLAISPIIIDISHFESLTSLKKLGLAYNHISDISHLKSLTNLTELDLSKNKISDFSPLESLINLTVLRLGQNRINEVSFLGNLTNLIKLSLDLNLISNIYPLKKLANLTALSLSYNHISNISPLESLTNLTSLSLGRNKIKDFSPLGNLTNLIDLWLNKSQISDISLLGKLTNLTTLNLDENPISDISSLGKLINLTHLKLNESQISDISPLGSLTNLAELELNENPSDISSLGKLINLTHLKLNKSQISDISPLGRLTNLAELELNENPISDISSLGKLINLTHLKLNKSQISDISPLGRLTNLTELELNENPISDISSLGKLINLTDLKLYNNQISDFRPLLHLKPYRDGKLYVRVTGNPNEILNRVVSWSGYEALKKYYDELDQQGTIPNDYLKVIVLGNSTAGKTSLVNYWGKKTFDDKQVSTHGIYTPMDIPLDNDQKNVRVNVWDFGGQDYYHATHRLFITRDSTFILVCVKELENKPEEELTTEYMYDENNEVIPIEVPVQHYPYTYWTDTITHLTDANNNPAKHKMPLFLVENKCALYPKNDKRRMRLPDNVGDIPFEVIGGDFYHLDISEAWNYNQDVVKNIEFSKFHFSYENFEENLIETLQKQIDENRYEVISYFPEVRDTLEKLANAKQGKDSNNVVEEINRFLEKKGIKPIEEFEKLPVWINYQEYKDIVKQSRKEKDNEENIPWDSLHIYLQNLCGRIFHFKDIPGLKDIVFIDPNWLHTSIYRVLNMEILKKGGEFTIEEADKVIDGDILDAATFLEAMKAFELIFEIPNQQPRSFIAPQYLPKKPNLNEAQLKKYHSLELTLKFPKYLPPSLISRIISLKGHLIKNLDEPLWKYGVVYEKDDISTFIHCLPSERKIEIYLTKRINVDEKKKALRQFMAFMEEKFSSDLNEMYLALPGIEGEIKWRDLYIAKQDSANKVKAYTEMNSERMIPLSPFEFLIRNFEKKPVNIFICYSHEVREEMELFKIGFENQLKSFCGQNKIKFSLFSDLELAPSDFWNEKIQSNININDVLICLLSPGFFTSDYIQQHEYGKVFEEIASKKRNTLIVPVNFQSCYINELNTIKEIQFFNPQGKDFGLPNVHDFSFSNLLGNNEQHLIANYMTTFFEAVGPRIIDVWKNSSVE